MSDIGPSPEEIAKRVAALIEAMRAHAASERQNAFVAKTMLSFEVIAAAVGGYVARGCK